MPPFLLGESYGDARMGISRLLGVCFALLFASSVGAAVTIDLGPSDYRNFGTGTNSHTGSGIRSSTGQTVRLPPLNGNLNVTRNAVIPYGSIANGMRNFLRITPASAAASAAVTGLFLAVDWAFDEATGQWSKTGEIEVDPVPGTSWFYSSPSNGEYPTPDAACDAWAQSTTGYVSGYVVPPVNETRPGQFTMSCRHVRSNGQWRLAGSVISNNASCPLGSRLNEYGACVEDGYIDLDPSDWQELESSLPQRPANQVAAAAGDTQRQIGSPLPGYTDTQMTGPSSVSGPETTSTSTDPVTGETTVTTSSTQTNISYGDQTITTTNTTTTTTYQNGQETSTTVTTETPGELPVTDSGGVPPAGEWPRFCDWATVVCDWLNWTQEDPPPEEDLPAVIDDDFFEEKNISFGAKSCPPDYELNLAPFLPQAVAVSFQPICDFAALIYYMVMAASYIIAAYISIGVARNA